MPSILIPNPSLLLAAQNLLRTCSEPYCFTVGFTVRAAAPCPHRFVCALRGPRMFGELLSLQVCEHLLAGLQLGRSLPLGVQQHRDSAHLQARDCEGEVSGGLTWGGSHEPIQLFG